MFKAPTYAKVAALTAGLAIAAPAVDLPEPGAPLTSNANGCPGPPSVPGGQLSWRVERLMVSRPPRHDSGPVECETAPQRGRRRHCPRCSGNPFMVASSPWICCSVEGPS